MSKQLRRRSISERLTRARSPESLTATLTDWRQSWATQFKNATLNLQSAIQNHDMVEAQAVLADLKEMQTRFLGLTTIFTHLTKSMENETDVKTE